MLLTEFVTAYSRDAKEALMFTPEIEDLLDEARTWAQSWGQLLHDYCSGAQLPTWKQFCDFEQAYRAWILASSKKVTAGLMAYCKKYEDAEDELEEEGIQMMTRIGMSLQFHRLNNFAGPIWENLIYPSKAKPLNKDTLDHICTELARMSLSFDRGRESLVNEDSYFGREGKGMRDNTTGALTEIDAYVAMLEMTRTNPNLLIVPAPAQFESLAATANADFVVIDRQLGQIRGIQVKTTVTQGHKDRYDSNRITLIDGNRDLHNIRAMRTVKTKSDQQVVSWPGIIAAHFLIALKPTRETDRWIARKNLLQLKFVARHYAAKFPSLNALASQNIATRILHDLTLEPLPEVDCEDYEAVASVIL